MPHLRVSKPRQHGTRIPFAGGIVAQTRSSSTSFRPRSNRTDSFCNSFGTLSSRSSKGAVRAEEPGGGPVTSITASTITRGEVVVPRFAEVQAPPHLRALSCRQHRTRMSPLHNLNART